MMRKACAFVLAVLLIITFGSRMGLWRAQVTPACCWFRVIPCCLWRMKRVVSMSMLICQTWHHAARLSCVWCPDDCRPSVLVGEQLTRLQ